MLKRILLGSLFILSSLGTPLQAWAQKQLVPALRAAGAGSVKKAAGASVLHWAPPVSVKGPFSYVPPVQISLQQLESLSAAVNRSVLLQQSRRGTLRELDEIEKFIFSNAPQALRLQAVKFLALGFTAEQARLFLDWYPFLTTNTRFAVENNDWLLRIAPNFKKQAAYVMAHQADIHAALQITEIDRPGLLAQTIGPENRLILVGEVHGRANLQAEMAALLRQYHARYPKRKIVLFSEFLPSSHPSFWQAGQAVPADFFEKNPDFANEIYRLGQSLSMDIYGLEDIRFTYQKTVELSQLEFTVANTSFRVMPVRNKYWEGIIRRVMEQTLRQTPDAVFFVYAGNKHISKSIAESLARMLQDKKPFCIELRNGFQSGFLGLLQGKNPYRMDEVDKPYLMTWKKDSNYSSVLGFDAQVLLPFETPAMP